MREQVPHQHRWIAIVRQLQRFRQVAVDWLVEIELAGIDQLQAKQIGEGLGDGGDAEQGVLRIDRTLRRQRGHPVATQQQRAVAINDGDSDTGDAFALHGGVDQAVGIGGEIDTVDGALRRFGGGFRLDRRGRGSRRRGCFSLRPCRGRNQERQGSDGGQQQTRHG